jgi:hypothetical protein
MGYGKHQTRMFIKYSGLGEIEPISLKKIKSQTMTMARYQFIDWSRES